MITKGWPTIVVLVAIGLMSAASAVGAELAIGPVLELPGTDTMTVMWETDSASSGSVILTGPAEKEIEVPSPGIQTHHEARLTGLSTDTRYDYTVTVGGEKAYRAWFTTLPAKGPYRVIFMGDMRGNDGVTARLFTLMDTFHPQFIVLLGDFVGKANRAGDWKEQIFDPGKKVFDHIPIFGVPGNHDVEYDPHLTMFRRLFIRPEGTSPDSLTFADTISGDLYLFLDIYSRRPFFLFTEGISLARRLKDASTRTNTRHIFVLSHEGVTSYWRFRRGYSGLKPFTGIMGRYGVTAIISGHDHQYIRGKTYSGVPFFVTGGGGSSLYDINEYNPYAVLIGKKQFGEKIHHFLIMDVNGNTCTFSAVDEEGTVFDRAVIKDGK